MRPPESREGEERARQPHTADGQARTHLADGSGSELVVEAIEEQAQAGARTDLDERQRTGRQRRKQYGSSVRPRWSASGGCASGRRSRGRAGARMSATRPPPAACLWSGEELDGREEEIRLDHRHVGDKADQLVVLGHRQGKRVVDIGVPLQLRIGELPISPLDADRIVHGSVEIVIGAWVMRQS